jgi:two-component system sensor histidine kinase RegB
MISSHIIATILLIFFGTNIMKNLRERNKQIIKLKQQAFEKDRLVKIGLFATSAAHELGSPLSTIAILISDLKNGFKNLKSNSEFIKDFDIIEKQIERCKKIISEILSLHGKKRLEKASPKLLKNAFNELIQEWVNLRCSSNIKEILKYKFIGISDKKIILSDDLKLAFFNIFDNAIEASGISITIEIKIIKNDLSIEVIDCGSGFDKKILDNLCNPNISSKIGHNGMGLYLAINCFKAIDGEVEIVNNKNSGAKVLIKIPLNNL